MLKAQKRTYILRQSEYSFIRPPGRLACTVLCTTGQLVKHHLHYGNGLARLYCGLDTTIDARAHGYCRKPAH